MSREKVLTWTCEGLHAVGKTVTTCVHVPLAVGKGRPTPDCAWTVTTELCASCLEVPEHAPTPKCQRCAMPSASPFCARCNADRHVPVAAGNSDTRCENCQKLWRHCWCFPYLYDPVKVYF